MTKSSTTLNPDPIPGTDDWLKNIIFYTSKIVKIQTFRQRNIPEQKVRTEIKKIRDEVFNKIIDDYNNKNPMNRIDKFSGGDSEDINKYWVFGYRAGAELVKRKRKISIICHLDTVPADPKSSWKPFEPRVETRIYNGIPTDFLIGRGAIDDKGPAVTAIEAFIRALNLANTQDETINDVTFELLFDTAEETADEMYTHQYYKENPKEQPDLGIVFDAYWSVRAEKGIQRPIFYVCPDAVQPVPSKTDLYIKKIETPINLPENMIPDIAKAHITHDDTSSDSQLDHFAEHVAAWYRACPFDDPNYHPADITITRDGKDVVITTKVAGAQHGSAPDQNRANGANPVVSLTNFLAFLIDRGILANNENGEMCRFIRWAFGTRAFGENHPDLLYRCDTVFQEGNGTTYALTKLIDPSDKKNDPSNKKPPSDDGKINLFIDVRYAIGHHRKGWDGKEGLIEEKNKDEESEDFSLFPSIFHELTRRFHAEFHPEMDADKPTVQFTTKNPYAPDIRSIHSTDNDHLFRINNAYRAVMGENSPMRATGGGTDAKGFLNLVTAGALFFDNMGPPVNYHGLDEGAPLVDLVNSGKILLNLLQQELPVSIAQDHSPTDGFHHSFGCCN